MEWSDLKVRSDTKEAYLSLAEQVKAAIKDGSLKLGEKLPSSRSLSKEINLHRHTITAALDLLVEHGWLRVKPRSGYFVKDTLTVEKTPKSAFKFRWQTTVKLDSFSPGDDTIKFNFQSGLPELREFPVNEFHSAINESLRNVQTKLLNYSNPLGWEPLRKSVADYISKQRGIKDREIIITNGSQEALYITSHLLLKSGDCVGMESLSYPPAIAMFKSMGVKVVPIKMDANGIDPEDFAKKAKEQKLKLIFLTPTHQFPTTIDLNAERRLAIYQIASKNQIPIIEDDYDHEIHFSPKPPGPIASLDQQGLVIYLSTFSKLLFPGARLAFMAVSPGFAKQFENYRRIVSHQNDAIMQDALARWIDRKAAQKHLRKMTNLYRERRDHLIKALESVKNQGLRISWKKPQGGMGLWLNTGTNSAQLVKYAYLRGVFLTAESYYQINKRRGNHIRIGYSSMNKKELDQGVRELCKLIAYVKDR